MSSQATKTNNDLDFLEVKVQLRIDSISRFDTVNVLELYGGEGVLWDIVRERTKKNINVLGIDINSYKRVQLKGDNLKFINSLDLSKFDVIDADAWGSPYKQLECIFNKNYRGIVHATFIQTMYGAISANLLKEIGYTEQMIKKVPSLFNKNGVEKFKYFLAKKGIKEINIFSKNRKNYLWFDLHN